MNQVSYINNYIIFNMQRVNINIFIKNPISYANKITTKKLTEFIMLLADNYYNSTNPNLDIDDNVFDELVEVLKQRDPNSKYFTTIGAPINNDKVNLPFPMFSLNKVKPDSITQWIKTHNGPYSLSDKLDGMSAMLYNGHLYKRGQGLDGQDIGYLLNYINIGNYTIKDVAIRGELIISKDNFKILNSNNQFKNQRNTVSGIINQKNPDKSMCKYIDFVAYNVIYPIMKQEDQYKFLIDNGFNVVFNKQTNKLSVDELIKLTEERKCEGKYDIDGIVIIDNDISYDIRMNNKEDTKRNPSYSVAFKYLRDTVQTTVINIEWNISRYNYLKPRIQIKPIELNGSVINYATGHNAKFIIDNGIGIGSIIEITKSGDVIPKVVKVIKPSTPLLPDIKYKWNKTNIELIAIDNDDTIAQQLLFELKVNNIKFFNEKAVEKLYKLNIKSIADVIINEELVINTFGKVMGVKMINSLKDGLSKTSIEQLMSGSGCFDRGIGVKKLHLVCNGINSIDELMMISYDKLISIKGIGEVMCKNVIGGINKFREYYDKLNSVFKLSVFSDCIDNECYNNKNNRLSNMTIVLTGFRDNELELLINSKGGHISTSVSKNTNIVICKDKSKITSKLNKAIELGIKVIEKDEFIKEYLV